MTLYDSLIKEVASSTKTIDKLKGFAKKGQQLNAETIKDNAGKKVDIAELVIKTANRLLECVSLMEKSISVIGNLNEETIAVKSKVIKLQEELIQCKNTEIEKFQECVDKQLKNTLKTELKSYSDAAKKNLGNLLLSGILKLL